MTPTLIIPLHNSRLQGQAASIQAIYPMQSNNVR